MPETFPDFASGTSWGSPVLCSHGLRVPATTPAKLRLRITHTSLSPSDGEGSAPASLGSRSSSTEKRAWVQAASISARFSRLGGHGPSGASAASAVRTAGPVASPGGFTPRPPTRPAPDTATPPVSAHLPSRALREVHTPPQSGGGEGRRTTACSGQGQPVSRPSRAAEPRARSQVHAPDPCSQDTRPAHSQDVWPRVSVQKPPSHSWGGGKGGAGCRPPRPTHTTP